MWAELSLVIPNRFTRETLMLKLIPMVLWLFMPLWLLLFMLQLLLLNLLLWPFIPDLLPAMLEEPSLATPTGFTREKPTLKPIPMVWWLCMLLWLSMLPWLFILFMLPATLAEQSLAIRTDCIGNKLVNMLFGNSRESR